MMENENPDLASKPLSRWVIGKKPSVGSGKCISDPVCDMLGRRGTALGLQMLELLSGIDVLPSENDVCFSGCRCVQGDPSLLPPVRASVLHL